MEKSEKLDTALTGSIDRTLSEPAYIQLANILRKLISSGVYKSGDRLPSEAMLCEKYGISPMTVRRSINLLIDQNVVNTSKGQGTFVKPLELSSATFDLEDLKKLFHADEESDVKLLDVRTIPADERIARHLNLKEGEKTICLRRVINRKSEPICYHRAFLIFSPDRPIIEAEMDVTSLRGLYSSLSNTIFKRAKVTIQSTLMTEEEAEILNTSLPAAAFILEHLFFDFDDQAVSWGWFIFRSDQLSLSTNIGVEPST